MHDKKRGVTLNKKTDLLKTEYSTTHSLKTFDDILDMQMDETIAAVVKRETYPNGNSNDAGQEDVNEYETSKDDKRFTQAPYNVAQNYIDRVQFRR